ncbi:hypothetical protein [Streptomyces cyaneochromogenes]|uniref:hypothetical protein n=1 Tax=Streptomyces cyaneochromogenes TaxID=2496836 RepID=UPI00158CD554|nr:hypothetical protein [Streptomyces cyaneochromogenes]
MNFRRLFLFTEETVLYALAVVLAFLGLAVTFSMVGIILVPLAALGVIGLTGRDRAARRPQPSHSRLPALTRSRQRDGNRASPGTEVQQSLPQGPIGLWGSLSCAGEGRGAVQNEGTQEVPWTLTTPPRRPRCAPRTNGS